MHASTSVTVVSRLFFSLLFKSDNDTSTQTFRDSRKRTQGGITASLEPRELLLSHAHASREMRLREIGFVSRPAQIKSDRKQRLDRHEQYFAVVAKGFGGMRRNEVSPEV